MHVVATAGHVDHGKSTLVKTLTGTDPDRLDEEKERGLTIDLGFGSAKLPSGRGIAFVDVPGHVRFLKNMLAGVGAVDACVFVVAATEGWKPQSEEHLRILGLLGIGHGVIAMTKVGLADDDLRELARLDILEHVEGTFLEEAEIVEVDALDGTGVDDLIAALDRLTDVTPTAEDVGRTRMWVDRGFSAKGSGTIVTGTLAGGSLRVDDELLIEPGGRSARVRALQSLHAEQKSVAPGHRTAANLSGVGLDDVSRGDVLVRAGQWHLTTTFDASIQVLDSLDHELSRRGAHVVYIGSGEFSARVRVLGTSAIAPGESGFVRIHLPVGLPLLPGDRFILRESGRAETVGGGEVLDVDPRVKAAEAKPDKSVERVIAEHGWIDADDLMRLTGKTRTPDVGNWVVDAASLDETIASVRNAIEGAGPLGLDIALLDDRGRAVIADRRELEPLHDIHVDAGRATIGDTVDPLADHPFVQSLEADLFSPPGVPDDLDRAELRELTRRGLVISSDGVYFAPSAVEAAGRAVAELLTVHAEGVTVAQIRDRWETTRKFALPLLAILDGNGMTRRRDDLRIAGPRLPQP